MKKFLKNCKGLTLLEAVLSIGLIGAGLLGIMYVFTGGTTSAILAEQTIVGTNLAREKMEQIIADKASRGYAAAILTNYSDGNLGGDFSRYSRSVQIMEVNPDDDGVGDDFLDSLPGSGYARVTVTVAWSNQQVSLATLITNYTVP